MIRRSQLKAAVAGLSLAAMAWTGHLHAQSAPAPERSSLQALRQQVERRFEPFPLVDGLALRPKTPMRGVRSIEVTGGTIAVDGSPVTGAELRDRIGDAADLVLQLTYLDASERRALFGAVTPPDAPPRPPEPQAPPLVERPDGSGRADRRSRTGWRRGDYVRVGNNVTVGPDEVVDGDVVAIGGSAHVEGQVHGDVVAVGGSVDLGPHAVVEQDVAVIGGSLHRAEGARVDGDVKEVGFGALSTNWLGPRNWTRGWSFPGVSSTFALVSTLTRGTVLCLLAALVVLLAGAYVDQISLRAATEPLKAGAIGFLAQLLFLPLLVITILVLVVTIVGIPLLVLIPFIILGLAVVALVGFTAVAQQLGAHIGRRLGWTSPGSYLTAFAGVVTILLPVLLARLALLAGGMGLSLLWHGVAAIGLFLEYLAWTVGFGAVALVRFGKKTVIG